MSYKRLRVMSHELERRDCPIFELVVVVNHKCSQDAQKRICVKVATLEGIYVATHVTQHVCVENAKLL